MLVIMKATPTFLTASLYRTSIYFCCRPEPRKRKVKAIDAGVVSKKRHPLSQEFGEIPSALLKDDMSIGKPATTTKRKSKKSPASKEVKEKDRALQDAVIAKIMTSIRQQMTKKNDAKTSKDSTLAQLSVSNSADGSQVVSTSVVRTLPSAGPVHTATSPAETRSPAETSNRFIVTASGDIRTESTTLQSGVSLVRATTVPTYTVVSTAGIDSVPTVFADSTQFITTSGTQLHLIGNQLVCLAPAASTVSTLSSRLATNVPEVARRSAQPLQLVTQQALMPMTTVALSASSTPFLSSVSSPESCPATTDFVTDTVDLTNVDEDSGVPSTPLDDCCGDYDVPVYSSDTITPDIDSINSTALEHAYFSSRSDVTSPPLTAATSDSEGTKKVCRIVLCHFTYLPD